MVKGVFNQREIDYIINNSNLSTKEIAAHLNRSRSSVSKKRIKIANQLKQNKKPRSKCNFNEILTFCRSKGFKSAGEAVKYYGCIYEFKREIRKTL